MKKSRRKRTKKATPASPQQRAAKLQSTQPLTQHKGSQLWPLNLLWSAIGGIAVLVGIIAYVELHLGINLWPWPIDPEITAQNTDNGSSEILPFHIAHQSVFFPIKQARLACSLNLLYFMDADRKTGILRDQEFSEGATAVDPNTNYYCDAKFVRILPDGSVEMGFHGGVSMHTQPGAFRPPMTVLKMCVQIIGDYEIHGATRHFDSAMFQWPASPGVNEWIKGPIAFDDDQSKWIPAGSTLGSAWALRRLTVPNSMGGFDLLPNALRCDWENTGVPTAFYSR